MKMNQYRILKSYFPNYLTQPSIFSLMSQAPWHDIASAMDIVYLSEWSGQKYASCVVRELSVNNVADAQKVADVLWTLYGKNWVKLWNGLLAEYNPLRNYDITEEVTRDLTNDRDIKRNIDSSGTVDSTDNGLVKTVDSGSVGVKTSGSSDTTTSGTVDTTENEITTTNYGKVVDGTAEEDDFTYGFNSPAEVPTTVIKNQNQEKQSGSDTVTRELTAKTVSSGTEGVTSEGSSDTTSSNNRTVNSSATIKTESTDTSTDTTQDDQTLTEDITRHRYGNIGQNTYQDLLLKEFELWKWSFFKQVFSDCDTLLTLPLFVSTLV